MPEPILQRAFAAGEIAPSLGMRADTVKYQTGLKTCRNFLVQRSGGITTRPGTKFCAAVKDSSLQTALYPFVYVLGVAYVIEASSSYFRFYRADGTPVVVSSVAAWKANATITGATAANPVVITATAHGFSNGDPIVISGVVGMTQLNGVEYLVANKTANTFELHDTAGVAVNGTAYTAYVSGGIVSRKYEIADLVVVGGVNYYCILAHSNHTPPNATYWYALTGTRYEIPTPYVTGRFFDPARLHMSQAGAVLTITHLDEPPRELRYESETRWSLSAPLVTAPSIAAPTGGAGTVGAAGAKTYLYKVTAVADETFEESAVSSLITVAAAAVPTAAAPIALSWTAVTDAREYRVYGDGATGNGTYGYLGTSTGQVTFKDVGTAPDFGNTPPISRTLFDSTNRYPATSTTYQQRRVFGGCHDDRERIDASQVGFSANFNTHSPVQADDAVRFNLASLRIQPVTHLLPLLRLAVLTDSGEILIAGDETGTLTPTAINPQNHAFTGAAYVPPAIVGNSILYVQSRGSVLRELRFDQQVEGYQGKDLTVFAAHLFDGQTIKDLAYAQVPHSIVWAVRDDGTLLGLTYLPEHEVWGWHRHDTSGGTFERVCVVPDGDEDAVFVVVLRGSTRYVERFVSRDFASREDSICVDASVTYDSVPATSITGLSHLNGQTVAALGDGVDLGTFTVAAGAITLPVARSVVQVGLAITYEAQLLDLDLAQTAVRDKRKRVASVAIYVEDSAYGFTVGPDTSHLVAMTGEPWETLTANVTKRIDQPLTAEWGDTGSLIIRQTAPLPVTILGVIPHIEIGG